MQFFDRVEIAGTARITRDGYFVADALVGRANNIQEYRAAELDLKDRNPDDIIRVFRPEAEVFAKDALASLAHRPVTLDHPSENVTAANWRKLAVGDVGGEVARDGEFIRVPLKIMDAGAVDSIRTDRREFSLGYRANLDFTPGEFNGQAYDASMADFRYNHLAAVKAARGGSELRIVDERDPAVRGAGGGLALIDDRRKPDEPSPVSSDPSAQTGHQNPVGDAAMPHVLIIDGLQVPNVSDEAKAAIEKLQGQVRDANTQVGTLTADLATANTTIQTRDGEIVALNAKLKDAEVTPERLQQLADARAQVIADAKTIDANVVTDGKTDAEIRRAAVMTKLGDSAKDMADAAIDGAFRALVGAPVNDALRDTIAAGPKSIGDARSEYETARDAQKKRLSDAWKNPANHSAAAA
jgi:hypothetical protein